MAWLSVDQSLPTHRKTLEAASLLNLPPVYVIGHLTSFWLWALDNAPDGILRDISPRVIAIAAQWPGKPSDFVDAMLRAGFFNQDGPDLVIHDWHDYAGKLLDRRAANKMRMRQARAEHVQNTCATRAGATVQYSTEQNTTEKTPSVPAKTQASEKPQAIPPSSKTNGKPTANIVNMRALWSAYFVDEAPPETDSARGKANKGFSELDRAGAKPEQMQVAKQNYCRRFPNMDINPMALAAHWHEVKPRASPAASDGRDADGRDPGFWAEWQSMSYAEQIEHRENYHEWCGESPTRLEEFEAWQTRYPLKPAPT